MIKLLRSRYLGDWPGSETKFGKPFAKIIRESNHVRLADDAPVCSINAYDFDPWCDFGPYRFDLEQVVERLCRRGVNQDRASVFFRSVLVMGIEDGFHE